MFFAKLGIWYVELSWVTLLPNNHEVLLPLRLFSCSIYALYSCVGPVRGLHIYLKWKTTDLSALCWELTQQCLLTHSFGPITCLTPRWNSSGHNAWLCQWAEWCSEPPGCHPLLPADPKGQLSLLHLPFWPVLKVCGLHSDALVTLKCGVINTI